MNQLIDPRIYEYNNAVQSTPYHPSMQDCKSQAIPSINYSYYYYNPTRVESGFDTDSQVPPFSETQEEAYDPYYPQSSQQRGFLPNIRQYAEMQPQNYQDEQLYEQQYQQQQQQQFHFQPQQQYLNYVHDQVVHFDQKQLFVEPYEIAGKFIPAGNNQYFCNGQYMNGVYPNQEIYASIAFPSNQQQQQNYGYMPVMNAQSYEQQQQSMYPISNIKQEQEASNTVSVACPERKDSISQSQVKIESTHAISKMQSGSKKIPEKEDDDEDQQQSEEKDASTGVSKSSKKIGKVDKTKKKYKQSRQKNVFKNFGNALMNSIQNNFVIRDLLEKGLNHESSLIDAFHSEFLKNSLNNLKNKEDFLQGWRASETADSPNMFLFKTLFKQISLKFFTEYAEKYVEESDKLKNKDIHIKAIPIFIKGLENVNELYKFKLS